jgi:hypothetical protein
MITTALAITNRRAEMMAEPEHSISMRRMTIMDKAIQHHSFAMVLLARRAPVQLRSSRRLRSAVLAGNCLRVLMALSFRVLGTSTSKIKDTMLLLRA